MPWLWLIGGVNGAGKSTLAQSEAFRDLIGDPILLNPDVIATELSGRGFGGLTDADNLAAARKTEERLAATLAGRASIAVETVLSTPKYLPYVELARSLGYATGLIYIAVSSPDIAVERVRLRVRAGGHDVAIEKVIARWRRSMNQVLQFCAKLDRLIVLGNDSALPVLIADATGRDWRQVNVPGAPTIQRWLDKLASEWRRTHPR